MRLSAFQTRLLPGLSRLIPNFAIRGDHVDERNFCSRIFWSWLVGRTLLWIALSVLTIPNAPLDVIEQLFWGHEWQLGYHKHPPLAAWIAEAAAHVTPGS